MPLHLALLDPHLDYLYHGHQRLYLHGLDKHCLAVLDSLPHLVLESLIAEGYYWRLEVPIDSLESNDRDWDNALPRECYCRGQSLCHSVRMGYLTTLPALGGLAVLLEVPLELLLCHELQVSPPQI